MAPADESPESLPFARVAEVFAAARRLAPDARAAFLGTTCGGEAALRSEVEALLAEDATIDTALERLADAVHRRKG